MTKAQKYIKILAIANIAYIIIRVMLNMKNYTLIDLENALVTMAMNLLFCLGIIYAIYKKHNSVRLFLIGGSGLGMIACAYYYIPGSSGLNELLSSLFGAICILILTREEVKEYVESSKRLT